MPALAPPRLVLARATLGAAALLVLLVAAPPTLRAGTREPLYRWTDENGAVRYTTELERIPAGRREGATVVEVPPAPPVRLAQPSPPEPAPVPPDELDSRIEALERAIAEDEAVLADYLSDGEEARRLRDAGEVDAIAERLPRLQEELRALRAQRAAGVEADAP